MNLLRQAKDVRPFVTPLIFVCMAFFFCGCGSGGGNDPGATPTPTPSATPTPARSAAIPVVGLSFGSPITVTAGSSVTWVNQSGVPHSVVWDAFAPTTAPTPGSNIGTFAGGATSAAWIAPMVTANADYNYHCGIHGLMMSGKITVTP